ncbi:MAG: Trk system potassium transporter TrkA [Burkholderiales bacterium]
MKIIILGAGRVGSTVAESLAGEANDITIVDVDPERLGLLQDRLDLRTVAGNASHPEILKQAGAQDADMILAVTQNDETNLVACKLASIIFNVPTKIARIRAADYLSHPEIFSPENFCVDFTICPEQILTDYIVKLIEFPEALQVLDFADGKVNLVGMRAAEGGSLVDQELQNIRKHMPNVETRVAAIFRKGRAIMPERDTVIETGDEVFFIAAAKDIRMVMSELKRMDKPIRRIMIAGGGNIGSRLAKSVEKAYQVKLIEFNKKSCERLAANLSSTLVLHGDATDEGLLEAENVDEMDLFCALTNDDENNIMAALLAKRMGARKVIALINRGAYVDLVQGGEIDIAISPSQATIGTLLTHVRRADVTAVHSLRRGAAEALELVAHGDAKSSRVVGRRIDEIDLPPGVSIGAIVRGEQVLIAHHDTVVEPEDHVIIFAINKELIPKVEKLFQVAMGFF